MKALTTTPNFRSSDAPQSFQYLPPKWKHTFRPIWESFRPFLGPSIHTGTYSNRPPTKIPYLGQRTTIQEPCSNRLCGCRLDKAKHTRPYKVKLLKLGAYTVGVSISFSKQIPSKRTFNNGQQFQNMVLYCFHHKHCSTHFQILGSTKSLFLRQHYSKTIISN